MRKFSSSISEIESQYPAPRHFYPSSTHSATKYHAPSGTNHSKVLRNQEMTAIEGNKSGLARRFSAFFLHLCWDSAWRCFNNSSHKNQIPIAILDNPPNPLGVKKEGQKLDPRLIFGLLIKRIL